MTSVEYKEVIAAIQIGWWGAMGAPKHKGITQYGGYRSPLVRGMKILKIHIHSLPLQYLVPHLHIFLRGALLLPPPSPDGTKYSSCPTLALTSDSHVTLPTISVPWCIQWIPLPRCQTTGI